MSPKFDYTKLIGKIIEREYTLETFAKTLEISLYTLSLKLSNKANFKQHEMQKIREALGFDANEIGEYFFTLKV